MQSIDVLAYKPESSDTNSFIKDISAYSRNSIVIIFNQKKIWVAYAPESCLTKKTLSTFFRFHNSRLDYYLYPLFFIVDNLMIFKLFLSFCLKYRVKIILVENTYAAAATGILKMLRLVKKIVYLPGDWLQGSSTRKGIWSFLGSNVIFVLSDYLACKHSDITLNCTELITQARYKYWGRRIAKKEIVFKTSLRINKNTADLLGLGEKIVFIGNVRPDSGLELAIKSLKDIRANLDVSLKIIGAKNNLYAALKKLVGEYSVERYVEFAGFVERENYDLMLSDCFCGINLLSSQNSYTTKALPAKIFDYLQYLLPVIATKNMGPAKELVSQNGMGIIINYDESEFVAAVTQIYKQQVAYRQNIIRFLENYKAEPIGEILNTLLQ